MLLMATEPMTDVDRLSAELAEARTLLQRMLDTEDRIGRVHLVMDDARAFLALTRHKPRSQQTPEPR